MHRRPDQRSLNYAAQSANACSHRHNIRHDVHIAGGDWLRSNINCQSSARPDDHVSGSAFKLTEDVEDRWSLQTSEQNLRRLIIAGLVTGHTKAAATAVAAAAQMPGLTLEIEDALPDDMSLARCTIQADRRWRFGFSKAWRDFSPNHPAATMVAWHWLATLPIFEAYSRAGRPAGCLAPFY